MSPVVHNTSYTYRFTLDEEYRNVYEGVQHDDTIEPDTYQIIIVKSEKMIVPTTSKFKQAKPVKTERAAIVYRVTDDTDDEKPVPQLFLFETARSLFKITGTVVSMDGESQLKKLPTPVIME